MRLAARVLVSGIATTRWCSSPRGARERGGPDDLPGLVPADSLTDHFRQKPGVKMTSRVKSSSRPSSIAAVQIQICTSVRPA